MNPILDALSRFESVKTSAVTPGSPLSLRMATSAGTKVASFTVSSDTVSDILQQFYLAGEVLFPLIPATDYTQGQLPFRVQLLRCLTQLGPCLPGLNWTPSRVWLELSGDSFLARLG